MFYLIDIIPKDKEIAEAKEILYNAERDRQQKQKIEFEQWFQKYSNKFFKSTTEDQVQHIKVFKTTADVNWNNVNSELWYYFHDNYYGLKTERQNMGFEEFAKEITEVEYYHYVCTILKKIGVTQKILQESNH